MPMPNRSIASVPNIACDPSSAADPDRKTPDKVPYSSDQRQNFLGLSG
jgi:hypothetical protein